jgi:AraC-like DNA-binding protein
MLAEMSGYSKFHFLRIFRTHTGMYLHDYINFCRLERVARMQKNGCYKKEIASALGFSSLSAFSRWHKGMQG